MVRCIHKSYSNSIKYKGGNTTMKNQTMQQSITSIMQELGKEKERFMQSLDLTLDNQSELFEDDSARMLSKISGALDMLNNFKHVNDWTGLYTYDLREVKDVVYSQFYQTDRFNSSITFESNWYNALLNCFTRVD